MPGGAPGYPRVEEDGAERACTLALAIVADAAQVRAELGKAALTVSVGIHAAMSIVGCLDGGGRPTATGEAPNVARQLQAAAGPGHYVLVSGVVRDKALSRFEIEPHASAAEGAQVRLQGRAMPVFALRGSKASVAAADTAAPPSVGLVGRRAEVGRLLSLIEMSRQGTGGQAVVLTGGAGHGKSALVRNVLDALRADDSVRSTVLVAQSSVRHRAHQRADARRPPPTVPQRRMSPPSPRRQHHSWRRARCRVRTP